MKVPASVVTETPYGRHNRRGTVEVEPLALDLARLVIVAGDQRIHITVADSHLAGLIAELTAVQEAAPARLRAVTA